MIRKNDIKLGDFLIMWENLETAGNHKGKIEVALKVCGRILEANLKGLDAIVLFGSVARGEDRRGSDVDLLLVYETGGDALEAEDKTAKIASEMPYATVSLVNKSYEELSTNPHFAFEVLRDGIVLYKRPSEAPFKANIFPLKLFYIYAFHLNGLSQVEKTRVTVALYGRRKGKYAYRGLLESVKGYRLGKGAVMVPAEAFNKIEKFFARNRINYRKAAVNLLFGDLQAIGE